MAKMNEKSHRETIVNVGDSVTTLVEFADNTQPNYFQLSNPCPQPLFVSTNPQVSNTRADLIVPAYGTKLLVLMHGVRQIYLKCYDQDNHDVTIKSWEGEFDPNVIAQSQDITVSDPQNDLGIVTVGNMPENQDVTVTNTNLNVTVSNMPVEQDVEVTKPLPAGTNNIGNTTLAGASGAQGVISTGANSNDANGTANNLLYTAGYNLLFNGSTWDRMRNNMEGALIASASRTASSSTSIQTNHNARGVILALDVTAVPVTSETLTIEVKISVNGQTSQAIALYTIPNTIGKYFLMVAPELVEKDGATLKVKQVSALLPRSWYTVITHSAASAWTYSLSHALTV